MHLFQTPIKVAWKYEMLLCEAKGASSLHNFEESEGAELKKKTFQKKMIKEISYKDIRPTFRFLNKTNGKVFPAFECKAYWFTFPFMEILLQVIKKTNVSPTVSKCMY